MARNFHSKDANHGYQRKLEKTRPMNDRLRQLGHYRLGKKIGKGGMGSVYEAHDERMGRRVALKLLRNELVIHQHNRDRFVQEARLIARLTHPAVVSIYDADEVNGTFFYAMEFVDGMTIRDLMCQQGRIDWREALRLIAAAAEGLVYAWRQGVTHRDIKPANLMLSSEGYVKVADFGIAKASDEDALEMTVSGQSLGTPLYMSPEQHRNARSVDFRSDVYSLGATVYHMVTGQPPFNGDSPSDLAIKKVNDRLRPIRSRCSQVPDGLANVIERMLARDPKQRYQSGSRLLDDLREYAGTLPEQEDLLRRANSAFRRGQVEDALALVHSANQMPSPDVHLLNTEAACLAELGRHVEAIDCLNRALELNPMHTAALHNKGRSLRAIGKPDEAAECFRQAIDSGGEQHQIWMSYKSLGNCLCDVGKDEEALEAYRVGLTRYPDAEMEEFYARLRKHLGPDSSRMPPDLG